MYYTDNSTELTNKSIESNGVNDGLFFIRVEMMDGSSQTLQISKEQAVDLGIDLKDGTPEITASETVQTIPESDLTEAEEGVTQVVIDGEKFLEEEKIIVDNGKVTEYRILHPLEMNLKPLKKKDFLPSRGRFKRSMDDIITVSPKKAKIVRTRSGRVTVPPKHIQEIYKRFMETNDSNNVKNADTSEITRADQISRPHSPILIGDFTPLRTNGEPPPPLVPVETVNSQNKSPKSLPASQFRCTTCNKAYIGKRKMRKHLKMFPDHTPKHKLDAADNKTWDCLIDASKMAREGKRGAKFCRELVNLLTNAKILVRYFFKLREKLANYNGIEMRDEGDNVDVIDGDTGRYLMNELLAEALGIEKGWYSFNENELCKDVSIFSFLENFDSAVLSALSINDVTKGAKYQVTDNNKTTNAENLQTADKNCDQKEKELDSEAKGINQCRDNLLTNNLSNITYSDLDKIQENDLKNTEIQYHHLKATTNYYKNKNEEICSKFLNDNINPRTSTSEICEKKDKNSADSLNFALETEPFVISTKIDKESTNLAAPSTVDSLQDVRATILDNANSNPATLSNNRNHLVDGINVNQLKYSMGELLVESLDIPPLEIFQFDSNQ